MAIDRKLCMLKNEFNSSPLKEKLEIGSLKLKDLENYFYEKDFSDSEDKSNYYIVQSSFFLKNLYDKGLFVINRNPIGFDGKPRISKGLSFLFSFTPKINEDINKQYINKIERDMTFIDENKKECQELDVEISNVGMGYNTPEGQATYIFFLYEISFNKKIYDILYFYNKGDKKDLDYVFQINSDFIKETHKYFMNPSMHFDITVMKGLSSKETKIRYKNAFFFKKDKSESSKEKISFLKESDFWKNLQSYLKRYSYTFLTDIRGLFDGSSMDTDDLIDIVRCLYKVPLGAIRLFN